MLSPDLVLARQSGKELQLRSLDPKARRRAVELADTALAITRAHVGQSREALDAALDEEAVPAKERKLWLGLRKLCQDECTFGTPPDVDPPALRREVFERASQARRDGTFDADGVISAVAAAQGLSPDAVVAGLFADLRGADRLEQASTLDAEGLVAAWERARLQAVFLRATRVEATVRCASAEQYRALFAKIKFRRLLHRVEALPDGRQCITLDGPLSLFEAVTRYGLELALIAPDLLACPEVELRADLRWGASRRALTLRVNGRGPGAAELPPRRDEVTELHRALAERASAFDVAYGTELLDVPGLGVLAPDLELTERATGRVVWIELLGFWSRDAVWKRVDLVRQGLPSPVVFLASSKLRVSAEVLDDEPGAELYVFKGTPSARRVIEHAERALAQAPTAGAKAKRSRPRR